MTMLEQIIENYKKLCAYCDSFFVAMEKIHAQDMKCAKGCSICCELTSVSMLEAYVIADEMEKVSEKQCDTVPTNRQLGYGKCVMLKNNECSIYRFRPIICRTHGCIIAADEQKKIRAACTLNFIGKDLGTVPSQQVFDSNKITDNLMRLNVAFCIEQGTKEFSAKRILLKDLARRKKTA